MFYLPYKYQLSLKLRRTSLKFGLSKFTTWLIPHYRDRDEGPSIAGKSIKNKESAQKWRTCTVEIHARW